MPFTPHSPIPTPDIALLFELSTETSYELPVLGVHGTLTEVGWPQIAETIKKVSGPVRLIDFSGITHCQTTSEDAAAFARKLDRQEGDGIGKGRACLILVAPGDLIFGLCRVIQVNMDSGHLLTSVARSIAAATRWLEQEKLVVTGTAR